jgi:hypothetical protein
VSVQMLGYLFLGCIDIWSRPGRGALALLGDFWYPVRLIQYQEGDRSWLVCWWRGCSNEPDTSGRATITPGSISAVPEQDIVDSLWGDRVGRRQIRVSSDIIFFEQKRLVVTFYIVREVDTCI